MSHKKDEIVNDRQTEEMLNGSEIAIIGMSCRFPGARNVDEFWRNLRDGVESISFLKDEEIEPSNIDPADLSSPNYVKAASVLDDAEMFDAAFFGYTPKEAEVMDPQHRVFLECAWEALENAGYDSTSHGGLIGVFAGARTDTYIFNLFTNDEKVGSLGAFEVGLGNDLGFLPTRVSYKLDLKGPSYAVHTACSTSLVAVHMACQSLLIDECRMALAGGIAINVPQKTGYLYQVGGIVSPDGHCRAFDAKAQGTIFGSGVGIVVLKRLEDALADGDTIHAVIKGSAINNDGAMKASFTAPSVSQQSEAIAEALANAGVEAETISYVETHGTGTALGDPIEVRALTRAFRASTDKTNFCAIGSVKTNTGHLDAAAGIASLIKTVLSVKHGQLVPSLHFEQPNPYIDFANSPFYVNTELKSWQAKLRRAGVSSFGVGGTNAHVIVEEAPQPAPASESRSYKLLVLSARTSTALKSATENLASHLKNRPQVNLDDVAYTLQVGRRTFNNRRMLVCKDAEDCVRALEATDSQRVATRYQEPGERKVIFMFPGQGAQHIDMGRGLYEAEPTYRENVDECSELLKQWLGFDLRDVLYPRKDQTDIAANQLNQTSVTQPALFVTEYALARLWMSWGVRPQAMIGHSIGEYVAACISGVFSLEDALRLVSMRGRMMQSLPGGAMLTVELGEAEAVRLAEENQAALAAVNGADMSVLSGAEESISRIELELERRAVRCRRLRTSHAFHSAMMDGIINPFVDEVKKVKLSRPEIPYASNLTGGWILEQEATNPDYWGQQMRRAVRFKDGIEELMKDGDVVMLEVGPGQSLSTLARLQSDKSRRDLIITSMRHPYDQQADQACLLTALGRLWLAGVNVEWTAYYNNERRRRIELPTYPFERQRFWIDARPKGEQSAFANPQARKKTKLSEWFYIPNWKRTALPKEMISDGEKRCYLVFEDDLTIGEEIIRRLEKEGHLVISVKQGECFERSEDRAYSLNRTRPDEYKELLKEICRTWKMPDQVIHLWSISPAQEDESRANDFRQTQQKGFYSLLYLAQAVVEESLSHPVRINVISNGLHELAAGELSSPEKSPMLAICKVIPQETLNISCRSIDVDIPQQGTDREKRLIDQLLAEIHLQSTDVAIAYRGNRRWVERFDRVDLHDDAQADSLFMQGGAYLITGGLGGVGLLLGEYLAETFKARLILAGRSNFPDKTEWPQWLKAYGADDETSRKIQRLQKMEALGAEVMTVSADVTDEERMQAVVRAARDRFGRINGVLHTAGITSGPSVFNSFTNIGPPEAESQFGPKVYGTCVLEKVLEEMRPDFCLLFSSNASVLGGLGLVAYSAANLFMDAFASSRSRSNHTRWISASWDDWPEETKRYTEYQTSMDQYSMTVEESRAAFRRVVTSGIDGHVIVSTGELNGRLKLWVNRDASAGLLHITGDQSSSTHPRPDLESPYVAPRDECEQSIANIWQQMLGIERVGIQDNFFNLGGHSLLATRLVARLYESFNVELPLTRFFTDPTVEGLARALQELKGQQEQNEQSEILGLLERMSETEVEAELSKRANPGD